MSAAGLFVTVFLACLVEAVEALTIVLAAGTARGWRPALLGVGAALATLLVVVAVSGPALTVLPVAAVRLVVGGLMLAFGLQWLRKAILRASGHKSLHDQPATFAAQVRAAHEVDAAAAHGRLDWYAFTLAFKGVLVEGLEVAAIALSFGVAAHDVPLAALAAAAALALVTAAGLVLHRPLARVPENTMAFAVGVLLTGFGGYWGAEGAGAHWPGGDLALPVLVLGVALLALAQVAVLRRAVPATATEARP